MGALVAQYGGSYENWPTAWTSLGLNDPDDGLNEYVDIVGDAIDPAAFWAVGNGYVHFRIRLDTGTFNATAAAARNTWLVMVDAANYVYPLGSANRPDYAFVFDLKGEQSQPGNHGLEMTHVDVTGSKWSDTRFGDMDNDAGGKVAPPDFSTSGGDGYVRTTDGVGTTAFGTTTFMDFAIKSLYLGANVANLSTNGQWRIQVATIENATDHNKITSDVSGNQSPDSLISVNSWSGIIGVIPEPFPGLALALLVAVGLGGRLYRRHAARR
jgi:hypothetical protein